MTQEQLTLLLEACLHLPSENEIVEFKKAQNGFDTQKLGEYFSALSNEANLKGEEYGWLLFGIDDKTQTVIGTQYKPDRKQLDCLKHEVEALNRIQLNRPVSDEEISFLRKKKLIEGRKPNLFIAKPVAQQLGQKIAYSNNKGFEDSYYCDLILKALNEHGTLNKQEITKLLWNKLPDVLNDDQKCYKVTNLLTKLRLKGKITNKRQGSISFWQVK